MTREPRTERFSIGLTKPVKAELDRYAEEHRWAVSVAAVYLIEDGLQRARAEQDKGEDDRK